MKDKRIYIRVSSETKTKIEKKASNHKTTISNYIVSLLLNRSIKVQMLPDANALFLKRELAIIGKNLWTLIRYNKTLKLSEKIQLESLVSELKKVSNSITNYYDSKNCNGG